MAKFLDERPVEDDDSITESFEETEQFEEEVNSVPEKYQNKSIEELVQMHQEAEKLVGKQSSEVGELRKVVDEYIHQQTQLTQQMNEPVEEIDFFSEPDKAVSNAIENHPSVREAKQVAQEYRKTTALSQLQSKHPEMNTILQDEKFLEWIKGSNVRTRLLQQADQQFDVEAADELFSTWKERQQMIGTTADAEKSQRKQQVKAASTGSSSGSGERASRKIYRRADIINLMRTDPARYQALSDEILKAYAEGRVKS